VEGREEGADHWCRSENFFDLSDPSHCGKLFVLGKLLKAFSERKEKVLVFSWSTQTLDILQAFCVRQAYRHHRLDGGTPSKQRQGLVDEFNSSPSAFVFLCSTKAGGVGINLQSASKVVVFDVNWNPSYDQQAQDRAYRIGQTKEVSVFRLVCQGTVEELVYMRQLYKTGLTAAALDNKVKNERMFDAIEGEKKGELYGLPNLMRFDADGILERHRLDSSKEDAQRKKMAAEAAAAAAAAAAWSQSVLAARASRSAEE